MDEIAEVIAEALEAIEGLKCYPFIPDAITVPAAFVSFPDIAYDVDMSDDHMATWRVHVVVSRAHDRAAHAALSPYMKPAGLKAIKAVLENDVTLSGLTTSIRVTTASVSPISIAGTDYLGATFSVETYFAAADV